MVFFLGGAGLWLALLAIAYAVGKREECRPALNNAHIVLSVGVTVVVAALIGMRLVGPNIFGTRGDSLVCADPLSGRRLRSERHAAAGLRRTHLQLP